MQEIFLSLEEILTGCTKLIKNVSSKQKFSIVPIDIKPGIRAGTTLTIAQSSDAPDLVFVIREKKHPIFRRAGDDIKYTAKITSREAENGCELEIPTLKNKTIKLPIKKVISVNITKILPNLGLPNFTLPKLRGNLVIRFEIDDNNIVDPIKREIPVSLEEILSGCRKQVNVTRIVLDSNANNSIEIANFVLDIQPGTENDYNFVFPRAGNQIAGLIPGGVVFVLQDKPHSHFTRKRADLEYIAKINAYDLVVNNQIAIPTLEKEIVLLTLDEEIVDNYKTIKRIANFGLPNLENNKIRGDILVRFEIVYIPSLEHIIYLGQKELQNGCNQEIKFSQNVIDLNGKCEQKDLILQVNIVPETISGTKIVYPQNYNLTTNNDNLFNVLVCVKEKSKQTFECYNLSLSLEKILNECTEQLKLTHLTINEERDGVEETISAVELNPDVNDEERLLLKSLQLFIRNKF